MKVVVTETLLRIAEALARIRAERPLVHQIANLVVLNDLANVTLHVGALPVMAHAVEEAAEMTALADALMLNLGTPSQDRLEAMLAAGHKANERGIPVVLDPVGAGATSFRTQGALRLLDELEVTILRANAGEIAALSGLGGQVKGVESTAGVAGRIDLAGETALKWDTVVAITGERDIVSDGRRSIGVDNGHRWLTAITGTGCMATTIIAAFAAVERDAVIAAVGGLACLGLAAEWAAASASGPASFKVALFDRIYSLTPEGLASGARILALPAEGES